MRAVAAIAAILAFAWVIAPRHIDRASESETIVKLGVRAMTINLHFQGWHVWTGADGRKVFANGPDAGNRHLEFVDSDDAVTWFYMTGRKDLARALNAHAKRES